MCLNAIACHDPLLGGDAYLCDGLQASTDPEYQALLATQAGGQPPDAEDAAALSALSQQQKEAGLASVFKRDDDNLARRCGPGCKAVYAQTLNLCPNSLVSPAPTCSGSETHGAGQQSWPFSIFIFCSV